MSAYHDRRHARLKAQHRCVKCAEKLDYDDLGHYLHCVACRRHVDQPPRAARKAKVYAKNWRELARDRGGCSRCGKELPPDSEHRTCDECRAAMREWHHRRGVKPSGRHKTESKRWAALDLGTRCEVCGLRGSHECLRGDATARQVA